MDILIATKNPGKFEEIAAMMSAVEANFYSLSDLGIVEDFEENGLTFEENALGKARFFGERAGMMTVADDSGVFINALIGELGLKTRRWGAGEHASDEEWLDYFMERMAKEQDRMAKCVCAAALVSPAGEHVFMGETPGEISLKKEISIQKGIPLSSVFRPEGCDKVYSALTAQEKNGLSHRGKAFSKLINHLKK